VAEDRSPTSPRLRDSGILIILTIRGHAVPQAIADGADAAEREAGYRLLAENVGRSSASMPAAASLHLTVEKLLG
jgi:hypothetical protein